MSPGTVICHIEMIASGFGLESRRAIGGDPVAQTAVGALECTRRVGFSGQLFFTPLAIDQNSHCVFSSVLGSLQILAYRATIGTSLHAGTRCGYRQSRHTPGLRISEAEQLDAR